MLLAQRPDVTATFSAGCAIDRTALNGNLTE